MYGWRARLGILVPSQIVVTEPEFVLMTPEGVSCHYTRIAFSGSGIDALRKVEEGISAATELIMHVRPSAMAMVGTGVSFVGGYNYDKMLIQKIQQINGDLPTTTTSTAVLEAFSRLGIRKVSIAMPYSEDVAKAAAKFVEENGIQIVAMKWLGIKGFDRVALPSERVYNLAREANKPESEAIFISCVNLHTLEVIEALEHDLQKPVITSNQATMWNLLRLANVKEKIHGYGQLLLEY